MENEKVRIRISSYIKNLEGGIESDAEVSESTTLAALREKDGCIFLSYEENSEGGAVLCDIKASEEKVTVLRRGAIESTMVFERGRVFKTIYKLPPYSFDMEIETVEVSCSACLEDFALTIRYKMKIGGQDKFCRMKIKAEV